MKLARIRAYLYTCYFTITVAFVLILMCIFNKQNRHLRRIWAKFQRYVMKYKIEIVGEFNKDAQMIILNHQSILDIIVLEEIHPSDLCWIAKKEIAKIPIIGKILTVPKMIQIDRENPRDLVRIIHEVDQRLSEGRVISMFPEGTRRKGDKILKFKVGAKAIASKLNLKVQPILIIGTREILNSHDFTLNRGDVKIVCLDLVDTSNADWLETTRTKMQSILDQHSQNI